MQGREKLRLLIKDINELKSEKVMLEKLEETLESESELLMLKAAEDSTNKSPCLRY